ncbi:MAG: hypothetical protein V4712_08360 [Pseudomonadota bacterium]
MSASDEILNRLVSITKATGPTFWAAWERLGPDAFRLKATNEIFNRVWAGMVLTDVNPGGDIEVWP